jgi:bifunctional DNA-binding transcriptional regulator/antitoxin component of YhaV-PrlF toxin-antitoxin module
LVGNGKIETWNLSFPATVDERGRLTIKKEVLEVAKIQPGDTVFLVLTGLSHKESEN